MKTEMRPWRHIYHDIEIPRHFFRGQKATTSRFQDWKTTTSKFQDQKATTSSSCGILTLMLPDIPWCSGYSAIVPRSVVPCSGVPALFRRSAGNPCSVVPCSGVTGFIVCSLESGRDRIDWIWLTCDFSDRKIEEEQNCISWIIFRTWIIFRRTNQKNNNNNNKTDSMVSLDFHKILKLLHWCWCGR